MAMIQDVSETIVEDIITSDPPDVKESNDSSRNVFSYDALFPALPKLGATKPAQNTNNDKMRVSSNVFTQVFMVPYAERKQDHSDKFGEEESLRTCQAIQRETDARIEISGSRDQSLTFVVTGKKPAVLDARKKILAHFQKSSKQISIPKEHHRLILGKQGARLKELERSTETKINVPGIDQISDLITITGTKEGVEKAEHEIKTCSDEQFRKAFERLNIPKMYHPFISGAYNEIVNTIAEETGARIIIPPLSVKKDEIIIDGDKEGVSAAKAKVEAIYREMEKKCSFVSVEVPKSQHKYVIGNRGSTIQEILKETGVSVEMPPPSSEIGTINLRGPYDKLGMALTKVCTKANSICTNSVAAPTWINKYIIGKKGAKIKLITQEYPKVHLSFPEGEEIIHIEGPPEEVEKAKIELQKLVKNLQDTLTFVEFPVDQKYSKYIIGKSVNKLKDEHGVIVNKGDNNIVRIEGTKEGVAAVQQEIKEMIHKLENELERDVVIDHRYFKSLIGTKGENIKEIREKFNNQVQITMPTLNEKSDIVKLRGPPNDVDQCHKYLVKIVKELTEANHIQEVPIFKQFHKFVIGKGGVNIRKIREDTQTKIDLPAENDVNESITVTGKRENVEEAIRRIQSINSELANVVTEEINIPSKLHNSLIGTGGKLIQAIKEECGGVTIKFPPPESDSEKVAIRGPKAEVERAKAQLLEIANERQLSSFTCEVRANTQHHRFLIGKNGANIKKLRDQTGARIIFPGEQDTDREAITIIGRKEAVEAARVLLEASIEDINNIVEGETEVDTKHHRHFVARRGEVLNRISEDCGGVLISFPRQGVQSTRVVLKGPKDCIQVAIQRIADVVADLEAQVTVECIIPQKYHRNVMGSKGSKVQRIAGDHDVQIKFPDRDTADRQRLPNGDVQVNGSVENEIPEVEVQDGSPNPSDIIRIHGRLENCNAAKQDLLDQVPITIDVPVPYELHNIIGQNRRDIRDLMTRYDVHILLSPPDLKLDVIKISGTPANVEQAKLAIEERCLKSYEVKLEVEPEYHPKLIGRAGIVITKIRTDHNVQINLPKKGDADENIITIHGFEKDALAARDDIMKIVNDLNNMMKEEVKIDARVHSRLIGQKGRNIRKIIEQFKVDIRFPRGTDDPDLVTIIGSDEEKIFDAKDHLINLEQDYLQDINENEQYKARPTSEVAAAEVKKPEENQGFVVTGGYWEQSAPDTASTQEFPSISSPIGTEAIQSSAWEQKASPISAWGIHR